MHLSPARRPAPRSHFLHFFPACVSWAARWHPHPAMAARLEASPAARQRWESAQLWELALLPLLPYLIWACAYYVKASRGLGLADSKLHCPCPTGLAA